MQYIICPALVINYAVVAVVIVQLLSILPWQLLSVSVGIACLCKPGCFLDVVCFFLLQGRTLLLGMLKCEIGMTHRIYM